MSRYERRTARALPQTSQDDIRGTKEGERRFFLGSASGKKFSLSLNDVFFFYKIRGEVKRIGEEIVKSTYSLDTYSGPSAGTASWLKRLPSFVDCKRGDRRTLRRGNFQLLTSEP